MKLPTRLLAALASTSIALGCSSSSDAPPGDTPPGDAPETDSAPGALLQSDVERDTSPDITDEQFETFIAGNNAFIGDLLGNVLDAPSLAGKNAFFSPVSISLALAMTYAGARGTTETEMAASLHFDLPQEELHAAFNRLDLALQARGEGAAGTEGTPFRINIANSIWGQDGSPFTDSYLDTLGLNYGAGLRVVDFITQTEEVRVAINDWVAQKTEDKILDLIPKGVLSASTRFVLTNAIYFDAAWASPFKKSQTTDNDFFLAGGGSVSVPTMHDLKYVNYAAAEGHEIVELPYDGNELSMFIVLPSSEGLGDTAAALSDGALLQTLSEGLESKSVQLSLPKFSFTTPLGLVEIFREMGIKELFTDSADLSGMDGTHNLFVSNILHKAFVAVDEEGTKAAAATAVVGDVSGIPDVDVVLEVNRPFFCVIRDNPTGAILFVGRVLDPSE